MPKVEEVPSVHVLLWEQLISLDALSSIGAEEMSWALCPRVPSTGKHSMGIASINRT